MKICVTGGKGMVGSCIQEIARKKYGDHQFFFLSRSSNDIHKLDLTNRKDVMDYFKNKNYDYVIHLAANVGGLYKNMERNVEMFNDNMRMNQNILEACHTYNINRGMFVLSSCVYPENPSKFPMDESMIHESPPHPSNEGYAYSKRMMEMLCKQYNKAYGREYICITPVNLYGPFDNFNLTDGHLIPMVMHRFYKECKIWRRSSPEGNFIAYGTGKPLRQFLYAPDFAEIICEILIGEKYRNNSSSIICCNDNELNIKEVINAIAKTMGIPTEYIIWDTTKSDGCIKKTVTNKKFREIYPNYKFTTLKDGLEYTYAWFCANYSTIRQ